MRDFNDFPLASIVDIRTFHDGNVVWLEDVKPGFGVVNKVYDFLNEDEDSKMIFVLNNDMTTSVDLFFDLEDILDTAKEGRPATVIIVAPKDDLLDSVKFGAALREMSELGCDTVIVRYVR